MDIFTEQASKATENEKTVRKWKMKTGPWCKEENLKEMLRSADEVKPESRKAEPDWD